MNSFKLEILTPQKQFFSGEAESVVFTLSDGEMCVMYGHPPLLAALEIGHIKIRMGDEYKIAFASEGFIEVRPDKVLIFTQLCEWPDEIDEHRAEEEKARALEELRQKQSLIEYNQTKIMLSRAMARLNVKKNG